MSTRDQARLRRGFLETKSHTQHCRVHSAFTIAGKLEQSDGGEKRTQLTAVRKQGTRNKQVWTHASPSSTQLCQTILSAIKNCLSCTQRNNLWGDPDGVSRCCGGGASGFGPQEPKQTISQSRPSSDSAHGNGAGGSLPAATGPRTELAAT